jgi:hypothetical protein
MTPKERLAKRKRTKNEVAMAQFKVLLAQKQ